SQDSPQLQHARTEAQNLEREYVTMAAAQEETPAVEESPARATDGTSVGAGARTPAGGPKGRSNTPGAIGSSRPPSTDRTTESAAPISSASDYSTLTARS